MKAIQFKTFGGTDVLEYVDLPMPSPSDNQVLIEVKAAGVNFVDVRQRQGVYQRPETYVGYLTLPYVPGWQVSGVVKEVGPKGDRLLLEKNVVAMLPDGGGYAQYVLAPSHMTLPLLQPVNATHVAALPMQGMTAYLALCVDTIATRRKGAGPCCWWRGWKPGHPDCQNPRSGPDRRDCQY